MRIIVLCIMLLVAPTALSLAAERELKVGFIYVSPVGDAGWSHAHEQARQAIEALDGVSTSYVEAVAEGPDSERVIQTMARKRFDLIFATSFGYMDSMLKVARQFPNTVFMHCSGFKTAANMGNYFGRIYQPRYLSGMVAGAMSKTGVLGYVAAFPIPEVIRGINAFTLGARSVNPQATVRVVWTKTWYDPAKEKEAAKSLLDVGADVIAQHQDAPGPQEAAQERGVYSIGYNTDMSRFAPKAHLGSAVIDWTPYYTKVVEDTLAGKWQGGSYWWGVKEGAMDLVKIADDVPQEIKDKVAKARAGLKDGSFAVWTGPVKDNTGKEVLPAGQVADEGFLKGINFYVNGIEGKVPGGQ